MTKTTLRELKARYLAVLRKCFLINFGILFISGVACAETISSNQNIEEEKTFSELTITDGTVTAQAADITVNGAMNMSGGSLVLNNTDMMVSGDLNMTGGSITGNFNPNGPFLDDEDGELPDGIVLTVIGKSVLDGAKINLNDKTSFGALGGIDMTNTSLTLKGKDAELYSGSQVKIGSGTNVSLSSGARMMVQSVEMNGGKMMMNNASVLTGTNVPSEQVGSVYKTNHTGGNINLNDGTVEVIGGSQNNLVGENILIGTRLSVANGAALSAYKNYFEYDDENTDKWWIETGDKNALTLTDDGAIDLAGTLNADVTGTGSLALTSASAVVNGNVDGVNLDVKSNVKLANALKGTLSDLKTTTVHNGYSFDLGTTQFNTDKFVVQDNATVGFRVSAKDNYGSVWANDYDVSSNGTNLLLTLDVGVLQENETAVFDVFKNQAGETVNLDFAKLSENARYEFVKNEDGTYTITGKASASDAAGESGADTNVQAAASAWLDTAGMPQNSSGRMVQEHLNILSQTDLNAFGKAVESLMPVTSPVAHTMSNALNVKLAGLVQERFASPGRRMGMSSGDAGHRSSLWAQGLYNKTKLDTHNGFDGKTYGLAIGIDGQLTRHLTAGIGYAYSDSDIEMSGRKTDVDTHTVLLYGEYKVGRAFMNGMMTYGRSNYDENKNVGGLKVDADYDMDAIYGQIMSGYHFKAGVATLTPQAGMRYLWTKMHDYTDAADQHVRGNTTDTLTAVAGLNLGANAYFAGLKHVMFRPEISVRATYDLLNDKDTSIVRLANGSGYVVQGDTLERFGMEAGAKLGMMIGNVELSLDYEGRFKKDYTDHTGLVNLKYNF